MEDSLLGKSRSVKSITLTPDSSGFEDFYNIELGNLYFSENIDTMLVSGQSEFNSLVSSGQLSIGTKKYYRLTLKFDMVVPDSSSEKHNRMALTQTSAYSIMDYSLKKVEIVKYLINLKIYQEIHNQKNI